MTTRSAVTIITKTEIVRRLIAFPPRPKYDRILFSVSADEIAVRLLCILEVDPNPWTGSRRF
jgi:hypothetical protein